MVSFEPINQEPGQQKSFLDQLCRHFPSELLMADVMSTKIAEQKI
jgi:hypothetical protein